MKKISIFIISFISIAVFSQEEKVGINTVAPTNTLDINGDLRVRTTPVSKSYNDNYLVVDTSGKVLSRSSVATRLGPELSLNGTTDMSTLMPAQVSDFYFVDKVHTLTLPTPSSEFAGKIMRFYLYGGDPSNFVIKGVSSTLASVSAPSNWSYSGTTLTIGGNNNRFKFINLICDGNNWWVDNR